MSFWRRAKRLFSTDVGAIVGKHRVFRTDSERLDDGPNEALHLLASIGRIVSEHFRIECPEATGTDEHWSVAFFTSVASRRWETRSAPRDYGPILELVNEALHHAGASRRLHVLSKRAGGQDFYVACATTDDVADLRAAGWIVDGIDTDDEE